MLIRFLFDQDWFLRRYGEAFMCLSNRFMFDLRHYQHRDGPGLTPHFAITAPATWLRLTEPELFGVRTTSELIDKVEESYSLPHEQATRDVEYWALDKQL